MTRRTDGGTRRVAEQKPEPDGVMKTTLRIPPVLWRRARMRALEEGRPVQDLVIAALKAYLATGTRQGGRR